MNITYLLFFFFNDTATTEIYTLSLHDALPISEADLGEALRIARRIQYPTLTWQAAHMLARAQAEQKKVEEAVATARLAADTIAAVAGRAPDAAGQSTVPPRPRAQAGSGEHTAEIQSQSKIA